MKQKKWKRLFVIFCLLFILPACQLGQTVTNQNSGQDDPPDSIAGAVEQTLAAPVQEEETLPESTLPARQAEALSQDELKEKWQTPLISYAFLSGVCNAAQDTIDQQKTGGLSDSALSGAILEIEFVLDLADQTLEEWTPVAGAETYREDLLARWTTLDGLVEQWKTGQVTAEAAGSEFERECQSVETRVKELADTASAEGLSDVTLEEIGAELLQSLETLEKEIGAGQPANDEPGMSRENPYPVGAVASVPEWEIQVLEVRRGENAWQMIQEANSFNDPAPDSLEYLLVYIKAKNISAVEEERSIDSTSFNLTGSRLVQYGYVSVVTPEPALDAKLFPGGEVEGWVPLMAAQGETNLILVFQELFSFEEDSARFIALDEGASLSVPTDLVEIQPIDLGVTRENSVPQGQMAVTEDWEITLLEMRRGEEAWRMIQEGNPYTEAAPEGMEYVLAMVRVRYIGSSNTAEYIGSAAFKTTGSSNLVHDFPWIVAPEPALEMYLFPGGQAQGWVPLLAEQGETDLILIFDQFMGFDDEQRRYLSLE